jgi:AcrR family transcriptional regulator
VTAKEKATAAQDAPQPDTAEGVPSRRSRKKQRTRRVIYEAAMELFAARGFEAVTINEICEAADVGRGTFFLHFPSTAALLYEFSVRVADDFSQSLSEPRASASEELRALVEHMARALATQGEITAAMLRSFFGSPASLGDLQREAAGRFPALVESIVARGQQRGEFNPDVAPKLAAASLLATAMAMLSGVVFVPGEVSTDEALRQFEALIFRGLSLPQHSAPSHTDER